MCVLMAFIASELHNGKSILLAWPVKGVDLGFVFLDRFLCLIDLKCKSL